MAMKRIFLIILDSFGIGNAPDAADFADEGSNTLRAVMLSQKFWVPNLKKLGLFEIEGTPGQSPIMEKNTCVPAN